jgi:flagellar basal body-associated protein FliL
VDFGKKVLKISAIVIVLVAITYIIIGAFFSNSSKSTQFSGFGKMVSPGSRTNIQSTDELEVNLDKVLINMRSGQYKYMKADITFRMKDAKQKEDLVNNMPRIRDAILRYAASQDSNVLKTPEGKDEFKKNIAELIYDTYGYQIDAVYFRNFVLAQ